MRDGGRLSAAIEILTDVETRHRPVRLALKTWGDASRYAGSKDRAWVSGLVLDMLRRRRSLGWRMGDDSPRAAALAALHVFWNWPVERIAEAAGDEPHGPGPLTEAERAALVQPRDLADAPPAVRGDYPDWLEPSLARAFGDEAPLEGAMLSERAPVDLRINTLKTDPEQALKALAPLNAEPTGVLPNAVRMAAPDPSQRGGSLETIPAFSRGWFEVQDLASQIAAQAAGDIKGAQVLDLCAGGGGKTLALAAAMGNTGQIYAYDSEARRLADTVRRSERAGIRNLQIRSPVYPDPLKGLDARMDVVFIDAPCSGSGAWRRHPDTKWRLKPEALAQRMADQDAVLDLATQFVKPGGRMVYVTCSVLPEEDEDRVAAFLARTQGFTVRPATDNPHLTRHLTDEGYLRLSPRASGTDGFFVAVLEKTK
ncbi:MAG: RsmB/NOP family class I SAM-dependent RNA methyltransferase [Phenylobacterium sp.]|uniref:RsmB/NOP family class I SAM-dependent RNA methyltransferase n=1 Tax=Phenylobacterium sp. TaxID=1871053 RepID=UPI002733C67E|nr:RsmB/NOP family class I SAM-dependent RNA methyltransferase [Phenylobacterium sp.]MDP3747553.1 RsmB/NOP family class I SAM-dependent RNA methyltransferase [Phenylobacterium sp.]